MPDITNVEANWSNQFIQKLSSLVLHVEKSLRPAVNYDSFAVKICRVLLGCYLLLFFFATDIARDAK